MWKIIFSDVVEQKLLYQGYTELHGGSMFSLHVDPYAYGTKEDMELVIDQINSLFSSQFLKIQNHKSLELEVVVKRVVPALLLFHFCFVVVHLLFSKDIVHLHTLLL